jgi:hypothetical protein
MLEEGKLKGGDGTSLHVSAYSITLGVVAPHSTGGDQRGRTDVLSVNEV